MPDQFPARYAPLGGINQAVADEFIQDQECSDARNYIPDPEGSGVLAKREGTSSLKSEAGTVWGIYEGLYAVYYAYLMADDNKVDIWNVTTASWVDTNLTPTSVNGSLPTWTSLGTYDLIACPGFARKTEDGTTWSDITNTPTGTAYIESANNILYAAAVDSNKLRWADLGTVETWPAVNELDFGGGGIINRLRYWKNALFVGGSKQLRLISGFNTLEQGVAWSTKETGCRFQSDAIATSAGLFFWSSGGLAWLHEDFTVTYPLASKLPGLMRSMLGFYYTLLHDAYNQRIIIYTMKNIDHYLRIDFHYAANSVWLNDGIGCEQVYAAIIQAGTTSSSTITVGNGYGYILRVSSNYTTDYGPTVINSYVDFKRESIGGPGVMKMSRKAIITTSLSVPSDITYSIYVDNETAIKSANSWTRTMEDGVTNVEIGTNRQHRKIKHRISDSSPNKVKIFSLSHEGYPVRGV